MLWWSDHIFYLHNAEAILAHPAPYKATALRDHDRAPDAPDHVYRYRFTGLNGFDPAPDCLRSGNNSSYAAIHLAAHLGARKIILLGVDMKHGPDGRTHWHEGYGRPHLQHTLDVQMRPHFDHLVKPLAERGITVVNANPESALIAWPRMTFEEALRE